VSAAELQACLARLYTDGSFRQLYYREPERTLDGYVLNPVERRSIAGIDRRMLDFFATSLRTKRRKRLERAYPALFALDKPALVRYLDRYHELYPLRPNGTDAEELAQFGSFMEESLREAEGLPPYAAELVRFQRLAHAVHTGTRRGAAGGRAGEPPTPGPADRPSVRLDIRIERFACDVSEIDAALREGRPAPEARSEEEHVVYGPGNGDGAPRILRVSPATALLLRLCDGTRTVGDVVAQLEEHHGQAGLHGAVTASIRQLVAADVLDLASDERTDGAR
jgi:hypothetical protein